MRLFALTLVLLISSGCKEDNDIKPFTSDGCTLFPDRSIISGEDWSECCLDHDIAYWKGGTSEQREAADMRLRSCVIDKTGDEQLAQLMYEGVRIGGSPYFYNWYRWGYGWSYDRKYLQLTVDELDRVEKRLQEYFDELQRKVTNTNSD